MLPKKVLDERRTICQGCADWNKVYGVCLRGHLASSPTGCPLRKFAPVFSAAYDKDAGRVIILRDLPKCDGCGG